MPHEQIATKSSINGSSPSSVHKPASSISEHEFVTNIYAQQERNAYKAMNLLDMWQNFERDILSEVRSFFTHVFHCFDLLIFL